MAKDTVNDPRLTFDLDEVDNRPGFIRRAFNAVMPSKKTAGALMLLALTASAAASAMVYFWPAALAFATTAFAAAAALTISGVAPLAFLGGLSVLMTAVAAAAVTTAVVLAAGLTLWMGAKLAMSAFNKVFGSKGRAAPAGDELVVEDELTDDELTDDKQLDNDQKPQPPFQGAGAAGLFSTRAATATTATSANNAELHDVSGLNPN